MGIKGDNPELHAIFKIKQQSKFRRCTFRMTIPVWWVLFGCFFKDAKILVLFWSGFLSRLICRSITTVSIGLWTQTQRWGQSQVAYRWVSNKLLLCKLLSIREWGYRSLSRSREVIWNVEDQVGKVVPGKGDVWKTTTCEVLTSLQFCTNGHFGLGAQGGDYSEGKCPWLYSTRLSLTCACNCSCLFARCAKTRSKLTKTIISCCQPSNYGDYSVPARISTHS